MWKGIKAVNDHYDLTLFSLQNSRVSSNPPLRLKVKKALSFYYQ